MYWSILAPVGFAVLCWVVSGARPLFRVRLQAAFFALSFLGGGYFLQANLHLPPQDAIDSLLLSAFLLMLYVVLFPELKGVNYTPRLFYVLAMGALLLWPLKNEVFQAANARNLIAFFCLGLGAWSILVGGASKVATPSLLSLPLMSALALSLIFKLSGGVLLSRLVLLHAGLILVSLVLCLRGKAHPAAFLPFASAFLAGFAVVGFFYSNINPWRLTAAFIPFLFILGRAWIRFVPTKPEREAIWLNGLAAVPLGIFLWNLYASTGLPSLGKL